MVLSEALYKCNRNSKQIPQLERVPGILGKKTGRLEFHLGN